MKDLMTARANFYRFLSLVYAQELTAETYEQVRSIHIPSSCGNADMERGYALLNRYFNELLSDPITDLAVDYAGTFLAAGETSKKLPFPYESVFTSSTGLVMQEAWAEVTKWYAEAGFALTSRIPGLKEDHIAVELAYMAHLAEEAAKAGGIPDLSEQSRFLETHLNNWVGPFTAAIEANAKTAFYQGIAALTRGFLAMDAELLADLQREKDAAPVAHSCVASPSELDAILAELSKEYRIYAPRLTGKKGRNGKEIVRYGEITSVKEIVADRQSDFSAKEVYYPVMQTMLYFTEEDSTESQMQDERGILIFAHPCDINAIRRLDNIFLKNGNHADLYYKRLRDKVKMVLLECSGSYENCYCVSMGSNKATDYSFAVRLEEDSCQVEVKDALFLPAFSKLPAADFTPRFVEKNEREAHIPEIHDKEELKLASNLPFWADYDEVCIGCGGCNTVCPTCACFDTVDVIYNETSKDGERRRVWSSCMLDSFTRTAGGARARKTPGANMRFKTLHKVYDYNQRFQCGENMCVGCGRCIQRCPKDIDFLLTINRFRDELEQAKAGKEDAE